MPPSPLLGGRPGPGRAAPLSLSRGADCRIGRVAPSVRLEPRGLLENLLGRRRDPDNLDLNVVAEPRGNIVGHNTASSRISSFSRGIENSDSSTAGNVRILDGGRQPASSTLPPRPDYSPSPAWPIQVPSDLAAAARRPRSIAIRVSL